MRYFRNSLYILLCLLGLQVHSQTTATIGIEAFVPAKVLRTMQVGGVSENFQLEYRPSKSTAYLFHTGFYYKIPKEEDKSLTLLPFLAGVKFYMDSSVSVGGTVGGAYTSARGGLQPMYSLLFGVDLDRFCIELKYVVTFPEDIYYKINGIALRIACRFK